MTIAYVMLKLTLEPILRRNKMIIELKKIDDKIVFKAPNQEETTLVELGLAVLLYSDEQIKELLGPSKPEWEILFQPSEEEEKQIDQLKSALDKIYSR